MLEDHPILEVTTTPGVSASRLLTFTERKQLKLQFKNLREKQITHCTFAKWVLTGDSESIKLPFRFTWQNLEASHFLSFRSQYLSEYKYKTERTAPVLYTVTLTGNISISSNIWPTTKGHWLQGSMYNHYPYLWAPGSFILQPSLTYRGIQGLNEALFKGESKASNVCDPQISRCNANWKHALIMHTRSMHILSL